MNIDTIPSDMICNILKDIPLEEIPNKLLINKEWHKLIEEEDFWKQIYLIKLGSRTEHLIHPNFSFRTYILQFIDKLKERNDYGDFEMLTDNFVRVNAKISFTKNIKERLYLNIDEKSNQDIIEKISKETHRDKPIIMALKGDHHILVMDIINKDKLGLFSVAIYATKYGAISVIQHLFENNMLKSSDEIMLSNFLNGLINLAAKHGHEKILKFIVQYLIDSKKLISNNSYLISALCFACQYDNVACLKVLLDFGANPLGFIDEHQPSIFQLGHFLDKTGHRTMMRVDEFCINNKTPLQIACEKDHVECVKYLLETNIDLNQKMHNDITPLDVIITSKSRNCINYLIEHFNDTDNADYMIILIDGIITFKIPIVVDEPILLNVCEKGYYKLFTMILDSRLFINLDDDFYYRLKNIAIDRDHYDILDYLIKRKK